ncbi:MAG: sulfatase [Candidatus Eiseniibacteriota bacterium]
MGSRRLWGTAGVGLAAAVLAACAGSPPGPQPSVVLIVIDTLRADHVGCYGDPEARTPAIDALAARAAQFRCVAQAPWTTPSVATILSGAWPSGHGASRARTAIVESVPLLQEVLGQAGWATGGVVSHGLLARRFGFDRGFDWFDSSPAGGHDIASSDTVTALAASWIDSAARPFFLFAHYFDAHYNYLEHRGLTRTDDYQGRLRPGLDIWRLRRESQFLTAEDVRYLRALYRGEIAFVDAAVGRLLRRLEERGPGSAAIVFTADHGEEFLEHGWLGHTRSLHAAALHVPLLVSGPGVAPGARTAAAMQVDVRPTILGLAGERAPRTPGVDLAREDPRDRPLYSEVVYEEKPLRGGDLREALGLSTDADQRALQSGRWKLIEDRMRGETHLYDLESDPGETRNLAAERPDEVERLRGLLASTDAAEPGLVGEEVTFTPGDAEKLRALGYVQ